MRTCPSCGRFITDASTPTCPHCGASLESAGMAATSEAPQQSPQQAPQQPYQPAGPGYEQPAGAPPSTPAAPLPPPAYQPPAYQPPYGQPPYGPGYGSPEPYSQPLQPPTYAPPSQPMAPPYGQPPYGSAYGAPPAPPAGQPTYGSGYGAPSGYPGAYRPGMDWKPSAGPAPRPWGRILGGIAAALVVIAIIVGVYNNSHLPTHSSDTAASATATAVNQQSAQNVLLSDSMLTVDSGWTNDSHCYFDSDGYHIRDGYLCFAPIGNQVDGTESVTVKQITGSTTWAYGLIFRHVSTGNYYLLGIDSDSEWVFAKVVNHNITNLQKFTFNAVIKGGLDAANTLSVTMKGTTFDCYINGQKVGTIHDSTFPQGKWGLDGGAPGVNVVFTDYLAHL